MSEFNFKAGDKVYCPMATNDILTVDSKMTILYQDLANARNNITVHKQGKWYKEHRNPAIFPATQEWYERLSHVYPNLEKPPIKKSSREIIQALLDDGNAGVLCWVSDNSIEPSFKNFIEVIIKVDDSYEDYSQNTWSYATPITPIKSLNQVITDYIKGETVLESTND